MSPSRQDQTPVRKIADVSTGQWTDRFDALQRQITSLRRAIGQLQNKAIPAQQDPLPQSPRPSSEPHPTEAFAGIPDSCAGRSVTQRSSRSPRSAPQPTKQPVTQPDPPERARWKIGSAELNHIPVKVSHLAAGVGHLPVAVGRNCNQPPARRTKVVHRIIDALRCRYQSVRSVPAEPVHARRKNSSWLVSALMHLAVVLYLACATFSSPGELNPLNLLLDAAEEKLPELPSVEIDVSPEPLVENCPPPTIESPTEAPVPTPDLVTDTTVVPPAADIYPTPTPELPATPATPIESASPKPKEGDGGPGTRTNRDKRRRRSGPTVEFFGTRNRSQRVVFLVDNSNSMHSGRFETALAELHRSVTALGSDQSFYVVFYSDTAYGLFHPQTEADLLPATRANKARFTRWLTTVEMCTGGQLLKAFELVERLNPDTVYLLSDGVIHSDKTMDHILKSDGRDFTLHSIGLTVPDPVAVQRLRGIAEAHGGILQLVGVHPAARLAARQRPIRRNRTQGPVWGLQLPAR